MSAPLALWLVPAPLDFGVEAAPIDDLLPRQTLRVAASLTHWVTENAKTARALLKRIDTVQPLVLPLQQLHLVELPRPPKGREAAQPDWSALLAPLRAGHALGLLSEAGLPAVADPGAALVAQAHREGLTVRSLAGSSSLTQALAASGLEGQRFVFHGYAPTDATERARQLREWESQSRRLRQTQLLIETPYRNGALLDALLQSLQAQTQLAVCVGVTTPQEWSRSASVAHWRRERVTLPLDQPAIFAWLSSSSASA